jgi:hypothetical protein
VSVLHDTTTAEHVLTLLRGHVGRENAITARGIALRMGWTAGCDRTIRALISVHANQDWPGILCAYPGVDGGYYFAANDEELAAYRAHLANDAKHAKALLKRFDERVKQEGFALQEAA